MALLIRQITSNIEAGTDEAGRGCLAGPVTAAAVILPPDLDLAQLNDSKKLTEKQRYDLRPQIESKAVAFSYAHVYPYEIDQINILNATKLAMKRAVKNLNAKPATLLIDGNHNIGTGLKEICIIKGDKTCKSIAAASIIAKFTRDFILKKISRIYPYYRLEKNKAVSYTHLTLPTKRIV